MLSRNGSIGTQYAYLQVCTQHIVLTSLHLEVWRMLFC